MVKLEEFLEQNGWKSEPHVIEPVPNVIQRKLTHNNTQESVRLWEIEGGDRKYIIFWKYAKKNVIDTHSSGREKTVDWKLLIDYADDTIELHSALKNTLARIHPKLEAGLEKANFGPGFDMLEGDD